MQIEHICTNVFIWHNLFSVEGQGRYARQQGCPDQWKSPAQLLFS